MCFFNNNTERIEKLELRVKELEERVMMYEREETHFLIHAQKVLATIMDNDKRKFMYEIQQEEMELMRDGEKYRKIIKVIN